MRRLAESERLEIRRLNAAGLNDCDIAEAIGRSRSGGRRNRVEMGLPGQPVHTAPTRLRQGASIQLR